MNSALQVWKDDKGLGFEIRSLEIEGEPWFIGVDVAHILDYSNTYNALIRHVDEDDRATLSIQELGTNSVTIINESGLYSLILSSKKEEAKKFKKWVTSEVLPSIRKTGSYSLNVPKTYGEALMLAAEKQLSIEKLEGEKAVVIGERDEAIRTKAWISDKKTATAMVTASHLSREVNKLREEVGFNKKHATIKKVEMFTNRKFRWKPLKDYSKKYEVEIKKVPDVNYGSVNCYHADAWYNCYDIDLEEFFN